MQHAQSHPSTTEHTGSLAMHQNPPPFKRFARTRFDGTSLSGQRPAALPYESRESPSRFPLSDSQQISKQFQPQSRPTANHSYMDCPASPPYAGTASQPTSDPLQPQEGALHIVSPLEADAQLPWRLQTSADRTELPTPTVRQRRRHVALRSADMQRDALLCPQLRPHSVAGDCLPRSVSQPNTPSFLPHTQQQYLDDPALSTMTPRSPIYPPANRRRVRSATRTGETDFTDEEFHLFVQATAGLGAEQSYRHCDPPSNTLDVEEARFRAEDMPQPDQSMLSPEQETPTTTWALQQVAQMPYGTYIPQQQEVVASRPSMQRLETSSSGVDLWLQPPSAMRGDDYDVSPIEDELPDYASSQAQAHAEQRIEAARRAQELQRRWRESRP